MNKIKRILKDKYNILCDELIEIQEGLSADNYKVITNEKAFFLKLYDKRKVQTYIWTENIYYYMPILIWLNENTKLNSRIVCPIKTVEGDYCFEDSGNVFLLFEYIEGKAVGQTMTVAQIIEAADILACLHGIGDEISVKTENIREDFSVPFCIALKNYIMGKFIEAPYDVKMILKPFLNRLISINNEVISLSEKVKQKKTNMVLCHTDAHGLNFLQNKHLVLVDWEGLKLAPSEADLIMFTKKKYWDIFIEHYNRLRSDFVLDNELLTFYILRRKIEDIWAFLESILFDGQSDERRKCDLELLSKCCKTLNDPYFEL